MRQPQLLQILGLGVCASVAHAAAAEPVWRGDFETGDLSQWSYLLLEEGLSVVQDPVLEGQSAGQVLITDQNLWSNGLNRVELQHKPQPTAVADGSEVTFGWSVYLPDALTEDDHQLGYWETDNTYRQIMSLHARGETLTFNTQQPPKVHWEGSARLTPGTWHRFVYHVVWSSDIGAGRVSLWFDGEKVVDAITARTYLGDPAFIQIGILRDTIAKTETLFIDEALEGTTYDDVALSARFPLIASPAVPAPTVAVPATPAASAPAAAPAVAPAPDTRAPAKEQPSGCSMTAPRGGTEWGVVVLFGVGFLGRRRRALRRLSHSRALRPLVKIA
jgi:hypothetical protein